MGDIVWGVFAVVFGTAVAARGWSLYRGRPPVPGQEHDRPGPRLQPSWPARRSTPGLMRLRAISMLLGGPVFVVVGASMLIGAVHSS